MKNERLKKEEQRFAKLKPRLSEGRMMLASVMPNVSGLAEGKNEKFRE
ncbi:MAG: hypothetical protein IKQ03_00025 [Prevotella sp.]|nr:hypothetical protein [Prevotella sp.]